ncbi:MAG TPA: rhomboid family intramembrane serine protease [Ferruginibacter sp.]|nr:rhomboid family intramembrane serine protease [Ferruginibacter sp.]
MGESDRYQEYKIKKQRYTLGQPGNTLMWLFVFNVIFFLVLQTLKVSFDVYEQSPNAYYTKILQWFQLPADTSKLVERPWTILSYMFSDVDLLRAFSNMLWLWAFGSILQNITGNKKMIPIYLYGGLAGALFFIIAGALIPAGKPAVEAAGLIGANAAVMSLAVTVTMIAPGYRFFRMLRGGIPIWVLTIFYIAIDLTGVSKYPAQAISHIGGAAAGFLFVILLRNGKDGSIWMNKLYSRFIDLFNPNKKKNKYSAKEKIFYNTGNRSPYHKTSNITEQRIDEILDKINQKGYHFLTEEEKSILKKASEE